MVELEEVMFTARPSWRFYWEHLLGRSTMRVGFMEWKHLRRSALSRLEVGGAPSHLQTDAVTHIARSEPTVFLVAVERPWQAVPLAP